MMKIQNNDKISELITKIKGIKNIKIIIGLIIVAALILTYGYAKDSSQNTKVDNNSAEYTIAADYTEDEKKLADILSDINGIGKTKVMISCDTDDKILGVIVVAEGAENPLSEMQIRHAVITALKIDYNSVEVFSMK